VFNNFGYGVHVFGTEGPTIGFVVEGLTSFENGAPAGERNPNIFVGTKRQPPDRIVVRSNVVYDRPAVYAPNLRLGFATVRNKKIVVQRNLVVGGSPAFEMRNWQNVQVLDNTVVTRHDRAEDRRVLVDLKTDEIGAVTRAGRYVWKRNAYFDECGSACGASAPSSFMFNARNTKDILTFKEWRQKSKLDSESAYTPARRRSTQVVVRPNRYEIGRAFITVLNWQGSRSVLVDPSGAGLRPGSHFEVRDVQDPSGDPIVKGTWTGGPIRIPLDVKRTTQPVGSGFHRVEPTPIEFGAFLLLPR
jgi:hypothetical protein